MIKARKQPMPDKKYQMNIDIRSSSKAEKKQPRIIRRMKKQETTVDILD